MPRVEPLRENWPQTFQLADRKVREESVQRARDNLSFFHSCGFEAIADASLTPSREVKQLLTGHGRVCSAHERFEAKPLSFNSYHCWNLRLFEVLVFKFYASCLDQVKGGWNFIKVVDNLTSSEIPELKLS